MSMTTDDPSIRIRNAIKDGNLFIVKRLLTRYPDLLDNIDPKNGWTNLHYASYYNRFEISNLILNAISTNNNITNNDYKQITNEDEIKLTFENETVLHLAVQNNSVKTLILLLNYFNVCIDQRDNKGYTPTHICCIHDYYNCLSFLLTSGAYSNIQDNDGNTPLHLAMNFGFLNCIELLINSNADDTLLNNEGWSPLDLATTFEVQSNYKSLKQRFVQSQSNNTNSTDLSMFKDIAISGQSSLSDISSLKDSQPQPLLQPQQQQQQQQIPIPQPPVSFNSHSPSISPKKLSNSSSNNTPNSKRSSMSKRTFRSNSSTSDKVSTSSNLPGILTSTSLSAAFNGNGNGLLNNGDSASPVKKSGLTMNRNHSLSNASSVITNGSNTSQESQSQSQSQLLAQTSGVVSNILFKSKKSTPTSSRTPSFSKNGSMITLNQQPSIQEQQQQQQQQQQSNSNSNYSSDNSIDLLNKSILPNLLESNQLSFNSKMLQNLNNSSTDSFERSEVNGNVGNSSHDYEDSTIKQSSSKLLSIPISSLRSRRHT